MIEKIGLPAMLEQAAEEASELAKAALKYARILFNENPTPVTKDKAFNDLTEEYSDFILCAEELGLKIIPKDASLDFPEDAKQKLLYLAREALKAADGLLLFDILIRSSGKDLFLKNIGSRYFVREILKSLLVTERQHIQAKVPGCAKRSTCTLSTLINLNSALYA